MKQLSLLILFALSVINVFAQDTLSSKNEKRINVSVGKEEQPEINQQPVSTTAKDTTYIVKISNNSTIHNDNGKVDMLSSKNRRYIYPLGVSTGLMLGNPGVLMCGVIDYLIIPNISVEFNFGIIPFDNNHISYYIFGGKYWFANKNSSSGFSPYIGLLYGNASSSQSLWSIPVGINYIARYGLQSSLQFIYMKASHEIWYPYIEFRVGWRFKAGKK